MSFRDDGAIAIEALDAFAANARGRGGPVIRQPALGDLDRRLGLERLIAEGGLTGDALRNFLTDYLAASTRLHHPGYMAHQVAVPLPHSAIAALVDAFCNNAMAIYEMGPAAATVEFAVVNWMLDKVGWRPSPPPDAARTGERHGGGVLTHGGSLANLTALLAARGRVTPRAWEDGTPKNLVIVASPASHYSIARAAGIIGLGQKAIRHAPTDAMGRLDPACLGGFLADLRKDGAEPLAVIANACGTALGLYDPLRDIAERCREHGAWLHVDGAHGASALLSGRLRSLLDGIELADSVVWDAHKMLGCSTLCAAVLVRDHADLDHAFREEASYLFHEKDQPGFDFIHRTVECTKAALGLKMFFALAVQGEQAIAATIERQTDLARTAAAILRAERGIELAVEPESNIVCFRLDGSDDLQIALRRRLTEKGDFYISTTEALGRRWLRLALMNPATEPSDIEGLIMELRGLRAAVLLEMS
ncbi:MAG: aminotransferase class V-fold PLP-dependent enzyme [Rhodoplanes sp.]|uniref:pyridoxal phosphate-dependent decarboxylase family protein n=1 Tax=Rhodoplanes sp. TaxID=1968906 RepID=UPI001853C6BB|nr:pyridoxal-dependent decarboxylase [Rhodoplanes sp.]NVO14403.1 aminotransferase class V-fold PLP-dependent enzyme [Rhodoplanes sp.]